MRLLAFGLLLTLTACLSPRASTSPRPIPGIPDTIYTASGATPVLVVDSIASDRPDRLVVGRLDYLGRRVYVSRAAVDKMRQLKVVEHERCHLVLIESGLMMHFAEVPWLSELLCDAFANAAMAQLERGKP